MLVKEHAKIWWETYQSPKTGGWIRCKEYQWFQSKMLSNSNSLSLRIPMCFVMNDVLSESRWNWLFPLVQRVGCGFACLEGGITVACLRFFSQKLLPVWIFLNTIYFVTMRLPFDATCGDVSIWRFDKQMENKHLQNWLIFRVCIIWGGIKKFGGQCPQLLPRGNGPGVQTS